MRELKDYVIKTYRTDSQRRRGAALETSKYDLKDSPVDAINRIHCFPPGNRLGEQWSRHIIRAIKSHQITTPRHRVSLHSLSFFLSLARTRARAFGSIYESLYKCNETVTGDASSITPPTAPCPVPFHRRRRSSLRSSSAPHIRLRTT